jgi:cell wall-associated NlpC family hydrolase
VLDLTLSPEPGATLDTQLLPGESFIVYETRPDGLAWGQSATDGYVGYVPAAGLGVTQAPGQRITALWSHVYSRPAVRARVTGDLPFGARIGVAATESGYARLEGGGFVPLQHLAPVPGDAADHAARFIGVPYLWGGRSARGLDCSALIQLAFMAAGRDAPRDTDMQAEWLGEALPAEAPLRRGDIVFWKGHVGIMRDAETLIHANGHHMAVAVEPLQPAAARIEAAGGGPVTVRRRLS